MKQIAPNCQEDKLWLWAFVILSATIHPPPRISIHLGPSALIDRVWTGVSELVIEIRSECGYFNQRWLLYRGRNEPAHHGAAGPSISRASGGDGRVASSIGCDSHSRGGLMAQHAPLMVIGIYAPYQKQSSYLSEMARAERASPWDARGSCCSAAAQWFRLCKNCTCHCLLCLPFQFRLKYFIFYSIYLQPPLLVILRFDIQDGVYYNYNSWN